MGQVTIYLDDDSESRLRASAKAKGVPVSRWIAELVREKTAAEWPEDVKKLAGIWSDLPEADALRSSQGKDVDREQF